MQPDRPFCRYIEEPGEGPPLWLVFERDGRLPERFPFHTRIELGRCDGERDPAPGTIAVADPTVSRRHCAVVRDVAGRCFVRDLSRNGTWVAGRRLVPNIETELLPGQSIVLGGDLAFRLEDPQATMAAAPSAAPEADQDEPTRTMSVTGLSLVTILVGDIRDYTRLVRLASTEELQHSVDRVFRHLEKVVIRHGGTVKEYQGDALFAFWDYHVPGAHAVSACRAAMALDREARSLAQDPKMWALSQFPLHLDWAITTGLASTRTFGGNHPTGLSMVGEPVVLAYRLEKLADDTTGPVLVCATTRTMSAAEFEFRSVGALAAKGFEEPVEAYALVGPRASS